MTFAITQGSVISPVVEAKIFFPRQGAWTIECRLDADASLVSASGSVSFDGNGLSLTGSVIDERSGIFQLRNTAYIVGGANGLQTPVSGQDYNNPTVENLLSDICSAIGETLSSNNDSNITNLTFPRWTRPFDRATNLITDIIKEVGNDAVWRIGTDGKILVTTETWPAANLTGVEPIILNEMFGDIKREFWVETIDLTTIFPGSTWDGKRISALEITIPSNGRIRETAWFESTNTFIAGSTANGQAFNNIGRLQDGWVRLVSAITKRNQYSALFPCGVVSADSSAKTVDVQPDSPFIPGLSAVPIRCLSPGIICIPTSGSRGILSFEGNDPNSPVFLLTEFNGNDTSKGGTDSIAINVGTTSDVNSGDVRVNATGVIALGDPDNAQFMYIADGSGGLKDYIDNKVKSTVNDILNDLQTVALHTHNGTAGPYPVVTLPSTTLTNIGTEQQLQNSPDLSSKVKNS